MNIHSSNEENEQFFITIANVITEEAEGLIIWADFNIVQKGKIDKLLIGQVDKTFNEETQNYRSMQNAASQREGIYVHKVRSSKIEKMFHCAMNLNLI